MSSSEPSAGVAADEHAATLATVLVVDDSELMRALISDIVDGTGTFRVIGQASTGYQAIRMVHELKPDIVTLDLEMPDLGGIEALAWIMNEAPRPVIVISGHTEALANVMLRAVDYGALEFVAKPHGDEPRDVGILRSRLLAALAAAADAKVSNLKQRRAERARARARRRSARAGGRNGADGAAARWAIAVAASTGGPRALVELIPRLAAELPAAVLVVQHMPSTFTRMLASRLDQISELPVREAAEGELLQEATVYLAPGGVHMGLRREGDRFAVSLEEGDPVWGLRPAADILFGAVARHFGPRSIGLVLTGMGRDGAAGLRAIREVGGWTAVQDVNTAVIQSMPRSAAPYAVAELPLTELADAVSRRVSVQARAPIQW